MNSLTRKWMVVTGVVITAVCGLTMIWVFFFGVVEGDPGGVTAFAMFALTTAVGIFLIFFFRSQKHFSEAQEKEQIFLTLYSKLLKAGGWSGLSRRDWNAYHKYRDDFLKRFSEDLRDKGIVLPESENEETLSNH